MAASVHEVGDAIKLEITTKVSDTLTNPSNGSYPTVTIYGPEGTEVVSATTMTNSSTGNWYYWWDTSSLTTRGIYTVVYKTLHADGGTDRQSVEKSYVRLY